MQNIIAIVSGLPRSGTSMMMRMLERGGMKILTDNKRHADIDNPKGYYEYEKVKIINEDSSWLPSARGRVIKMVSMLLYELPQNESYKIIFMQRKIHEILISQRKMLERQKTGQSDVDYTKMERLYRQHYDHIEPWLHSQANIDVLFVNYNNLIENSYEYIKKVNNFLDRNLDVNKMMDVVDRSLYRNRI
jgi:hypothetical protein